MTELGVVEGQGLGERFEEALAYAAQLHAAQTRKASGTPYIAHLLGVAALVLESGAEEDEAIAALLHDAIEDQGGAVVREEIHQRFGDRVAAIVDACSDAETLPKPPWRERKECFLASLHQAEPAVLRVVAADKLHNVHSLLRAYRQQGEGLWVHFRGGKEGTLWYHQEAARILSARGEGWLFEELADAVEELLRATAEIEALGVSENP
jgi:(p)ppGpp synthase/HD superfamily hydrolase